MWGRTRGETRGVWDATLEGQSLAGWGPSSHVMVMGGGSQTLLLGSQGGLLFAVCLSPELLLLLLSCLTSPRGLGGGLEAELRS